MSRKIPKSLKPEEFKALIKRIPPGDKRSRTAFLLAYGAGLRVSEVINLTKECVHKPLLVLCMDNDDPKCTKI